MNWPYLFLVVKKYTIHTCLGQCWRSYTIQRVSKCHSRKTHCLLWCDIQRRATTDGYYFIGSADPLLYIEPRTCQPFSFFNVALMLRTFFSVGGRLMSAYIFIYLFISHLFVLHIYLWIEPLSSVYNILQRTSDCILWRFVSYHFVKLQHTASERNVKSTKKPKKKKKRMSRREWKPKTKGTHKNTACMLMAGKSISIKWQTYWKGIGLKLSMLLES